MASLRTMLMAGVVGLAGAGLAVAQTNPTPAPAETTPAPAATTPAPAATAPKPMAQSKVPMTMKERHMAMSRRRIEHVQMALNAAGAKLELDGIWGPKTETALKEFQKAHGLNVTGRLDRATQKQLRSKQS